MFDEIFKSSISVNTEISSGRGSECSQLSFNIGFWWKMFHNIIVICELNYLRNIYFDFMEILHCDKSKNYILTSLCHFKLHIKTEITAIKKFAMNDLTESIHVCEPFWLTWEGIS